MAGNRFDQSLGIRLVEASKDAFPAKGKTARSVVLAVFEEVIEDGAALAVISLNMAEMFAKSGQVGAREFLRVGQEAFAAVNRPGIVGGESIQREFVLSEGAAVVAKKDFGRQPVFGFTN